MRDRPDPDARYSATATVDKQGLGKQRVSAPCPQPGCPQRFPNPAFRFAGKAIPSAGMSVNNRARFT